MNQKITMCSLEMFCIVTYKHFIICVQVAYLFMHLNLQVGDYLLYYDSYYTLK